MAMCQRREAAMACGQPVSSWRNWERDGRMPRDYMAVCQQISERTGADLAWLAGLPSQPMREVSDPTVSIRWCPETHLDLVA